MLIQRPTVGSKTVTGARLATSGEVSGRVARPAMSPSGWVSTTPPTTGGTIRHLDHHVRGAGEFSRRVAVPSGPSSTSSVRRLTPS